VVRWRPLAFVLAVVLVATALDGLFVIRMIERGAISWPTIAEGVGVAIACVGLWHLLPDRRDASVALGVVGVLLIIGLGRQSTPVLTSFANTSFGAASATVLLLRVVSARSTDRTEDEQPAVPTT
jgi:hypothetical protein